MKIFSINENKLERKNGIHFRSDKKSKKKGDKKEIDGEKKLQELIFKTPKLFPVWECTETARAQWIPLAEEITLRQLGMGRLDILATDDEGNIFILECKLEDNHDMKTIRSQLNNYTSGFYNDNKTNGIDSFWEWLIENIEKENKKLNIIFEENGIDDEKEIEEIIKNMKRNFEDNNIILVFAVDKITENLRTNIDWWNNALNEKNHNYPSYAFEVTQYSDSENDKKPSTIVTQLFPFDHYQIINKNKKTNYTRPKRTSKNWIQLINDNDKLNKTQKSDIIKFKEDLQELIEKKDKGQLEYSDAIKSRLMPKFSNYERRSPIGVLTTGELCFQFGLIRNEDSNNPKFRVAEKKFREKITKYNAFKHVSKVKNPKLHSLPQEHWVEAEIWLPHSKDVLDILEEVFITKE